MREYRRVSDDYQLQAVKNSYSIAGVLRYIGGNPNSSGQHDWIKKRIIASGIDTSHFTGQGWNKGSIEYKTDEAFAEGSTVKRNQIRTWVIRDHLIPYECAFCGNKGEWQGKQMALELDHINGVHNDHRLENLRFLCPNCHAITDTYCGKNNRKPKEKKKKKESVFAPMPPAMEIATLIVKMRKADVAKHYNVSCTTIDRWCDKHGIPHQVEKLGEWAVSQDPSLKPLWEKRKSEMHPDNSTTDERHAMRPSLVDKPLRYCANCGKLLKTNATYCRPCSQRRLLQRPSPIEIAEKVKEKGFWNAAKDYGVSDNAVRKWCKDYGIPIHTKELIQWLEDQQ